MNKSSLLVSVVGLVLALGATMLWLIGGGSVAPAPPTEQVFEEQADDASLASFAEAEVADARFDAAAAEDYDEADRSEVDLQVDEAARLVIQVWDRKKGKVAPEAKVFVLEGYDGRGRRDAFAPHWCELAIQNGKRYTATTEGRVELPRLTKATIIAATLPGSSGMTRLRPGHRETESVLLLAEETVTVRVTDPRGRPVADVPVGLQQRVPERINTDRLIRQWKEVEASVVAAQKSIAVVANGDARARAERRLRSVERERRQLTVQMRDMKKAMAAQSAAKAKGQGSALAVKGKKAGKMRLPGGKRTEYLTKAKMELKARRRTDANGYAVFRHFQFYRENASGWWPKQDVNRFEAALMIPLVEPVRAGFRGKPVPEDVIELRMPPTGSVALRTVDRDGRPFTHPVHGELRIIDGKNPAWMRLPIRKEQNEREIVFPFVGLGMQLDASCRLDDNDFRWRAPQFAGPQQPGERLTVDLVVAPNAAMLYGRMLDVSGAALANAKTTFLINSIRGRLEGEEVLLDDEGRFHLPYQVNGQHQAPWRLQVRYQGSVPIPGLATTLPTLPKEGVLDIGDLQIGTLEHIAIGRVVNDLGEAIPGARVQLQRERESGRRARLSWQDEAFTVTTTDEDGQFMLFGDLEAGRYRLRVTASEHFPYEEPFLPSREGAVLELARRSRVVGSVLLPEWLSSRRLKVRLEDANDTSRGREDRIRGYRGQQLIYFDWVKPGVYNLSLRLEDFPDAFLTVSNFEVKPGQRDAHPRLKDLDLARDIHRFEVFAVDENGKRINPKTPLRARVMRPDGRYAMVGFNWKNGRAEILSAQPTLQVVPEEPGYRAQPTTLIAGRNDLQFRAVPAVVLHAPGVRQLVGDESVWISMELIETQGVEAFDSRSRRLAQTMRRASSSHGQLNAGDRASLRPLRDGRYRVIARLGDKRRGGLVSVTLGEVDVRLVPGGQGNQFTVAVDTQAVIAAMQEVAQRRAAAAAAGARRGK